MKLIVGLGNPGASYAKNRHNVGFQCVERFIKRHGLVSERVMFKALVNAGQIDDTKVVLARPLTFMNLSGQAVRPLLRWYHVPLSDLLVVYDDLDLPLGKIRLRQRGSAGGHRGMRSIIEALGSEEFPRLRIGIGRPIHGDPQDYVLSDFTSDESILMEDVYERAVDAIEIFITEGIVAAMNKCNITNK